MGLFEIIKKAFYKTYKTKETTLINCDPPPPPPPRPEVGHINFRNTRVITRKFCRKTLEEKVDKLDGYYDKKTGRLYHHEDFDDLS